MVITFTALLIGLLACCRPLQKNNFYLLHSAFIILVAYYIENHYFRCTPFAPKTFLLFAIFHLISINLVTVWAYFIDKKAACKGTWRVPEARLHSLELLGGWPGAFVAQKLFHHKTKKQSYQTFFLLIVAFEVAIIYFIIQYLKY